MSRTTAEQFDELAANMAQLGFPVQAAALRQAAETEAALAEFCAKVRTESREGFDYDLAVEFNTRDGVVRVRDLIRRDLGAAWRGPAAEVPHV